LDENADEDPLRSSCIRADSKKTPEATGERGKTPEAIASIFELANASPILHEDAGFAKA
jgi:hypothetical protein